MAVEQMKYISIMGPLNMFSEFTLRHVINSDVQLEPAFKSVNVPGLIPFEEDNSLDNFRRRMRILNERFRVKVRKYDKSALETELLVPLDTAAISEFVGKMEEKLLDFGRKADFYHAEIQQREQILKQILPLAGLEIDIDQMFHFSFMKFRFGFLPKDIYNKQKAYLEELDVVFVPVSESGGHIWLSYFMPNAVAPVIDNVFAALGFERVRISEQAKGMPKVTIERLRDEIETIKKRIQKQENELEAFLSENREQFDHFYHKILYLSKVNEVKKFCSHSRETFFMVGWIPVESFKQFSKEVDLMERIIISSEDSDCVVNSMQPTIMKNNRFFKPFESLVSMYGIPSSREIDPTPILTITYVLMFGFMFGDVGQGAIIALLGLYLSERKKMALGGIMVYVGISSVFFGLVYGSVFGNEEWLSPLWSSPLHGKDTINALLYGAVGYGALIIILTIIINIINSIRMKRWGKLLFDKNGIAGLLFYGGLATVVVVSLLTGQFVMSGFAFIFVVVLPALMIFFREPLENLVMKRDHIFPKEKGMFFVEAFFELFEAMLSFFSGTVSFARVGAFALNHAGLSLAVWTLYNMMEGVGGIIVVIIGNLLTIGLEGLIVGIQCMRLEYYEIFGRFYEGEGHEFKSVSVSED